MPILGGSSPAPILAIDIGGSSVKSGLVLPGGGRWRLVERFEPLPVTERTFKPLRALVVSAAARALEVAPELSVVGISTTGSATPDNVVLGAGFFEGYQDIIWKAELDDAIPGRQWEVRVVNDGRAAAWGTYLEDERARGLSLAHFVVGTGIGGGLVVHGQLVHGAHNFAGVLGHLRVTREETAPCVCGRQGCVELFAGGPAVLRDAAANGAGPAAESVLRLADAARQGSVVAREAFRTGGAWLGQAIALVANILDPEVVTIGGGVVAAADYDAGGARNWYVDAAADAAREAALPRIAARFTVLRASLLNDAALIGAAALAWDQARG
ncbi:MAG: ROK family protein [Vicinamibacterales bacterium]